MYTYSFVLDEEESEEESFLSNAFFTGESRIRYERANKRIRSFNRIIDCQVKINIVFFFFNIFVESINFRSRLKITRREKWRINGSIRVKSNGWTEDRD